MVVHVRLTRASAILAGMAWVGCATNVAEPSDSTQDEPGFSADGKADGPTAEDSRTSIPATEAPPRLARLAESVALVVRRGKVGPSDIHGNVILKTEAPWCDEGLSVSGRPWVYDSCTAFLVAPDIVTSTCSHAVRFNQYAFVFDPQPDRTNPNQLSVHEGNVYVGTEVIHEEWNVPTSDFFDPPKYYQAYGWSLVRLDRPVEGRPPLPLDFDFGAVQPGQEVIVVGHAGGTSATIERGVRISDYSDLDNSFTAPIAAFWGTSGSPVIHAGTGRVLGMIFVPNMFPGFRRFSAVTGEPECTFTSCWTGMDCTQATVTHLSWIREAFESEVGVMVPTSCIGSCGRNAGRCSCQPACVEEGDCCDDYQSFCAIGG